MGQETTQSLCVQPAVVLGCRELYHSQCYAPQMHHFQTWVWIGLDWALWCNPLLCICCWLQMVSPPWRILILRSDIVRNGALGMEPFLTLKEVNILSLLPLGVISSEGVNQAPSGWRKILRHLHQSQDRWVAKCHMRVSFVLIECLHNSREPDLSVVRVRKIATVSWLRKWRKWCRQRVNKAPIQELKFSPATHYPRSVSVKVFWINMSGINGFFTGL